MKINKRVCNICGKEIKEVEYSHKNYISSFEYAPEHVINYFSISGRMPYGSEFDGNYIDLDICCDCMDEIIKQCKVSPIIEYSKSYV